ncbi:efflux transporter outer membrane subunit [Vogesella indigofera]|uniref:efflux transporter outer membrane subunit n=1 Tax=Vogesella indigofera TaxID=45465 RepID=UPI0035B09E8C
MKRTTFVRRPVLALFPALGAALMLVGCANPGGAIPSQARLANINLLNTAESLIGHTVSPANWPHANWWQRYGDPQLNQIVAEALVDSPSLRVAQSRMRQAEAVSGLAKAAGKPQINASLKSTRQKYSEHSTVPKLIAEDWQTFNDATLSFSYELDIWGKNEASVQAALDRLHATEVETQAARLILTSGLVQTYFRLAQSHEQLELSESILKQRENIVQLTSQRVAAGIDSDVELKQAESLVPAAKQQVAAMKEIIAVLRNQLAALLGKGPDRGLALHRPKLALDEPTGLPSVLPVDLIGHRPDVVAQRWRVEAASQEIKVAHKQFYPSVSLLSFVGFQSLGLDLLLKSGSQTAGIGPAVSLPIFDGGRLRSNLGVRNADYDIAVEQYNQTIVDALQDVVSQLTSIQWLAEQRHQQELAVQTAQTAYQLALQRYRAGLGTYLQVLATGIQVHGQNKLLIDLKTRALQLDVNLIRSLGGGLLET